MSSHSAGFTLRVALSGIALLLVGCQSGTTLTASRTAAVGRISSAAPGLTASKSHIAGHPAARPGSSAPASGTATPGALSSAPKSPRPSPTPGPTSGLKPPIKGLIYLQGVPPATLRPFMSGYDIQGRGGDYGDVSWAELQPVAGGPIAADNPIDQAITDVRAWNAANPSHQEHLLLRINAGVHSPAWALNLGGPCVNVTDAVFNLHGCTPRFWTPQYAQAFYQFEAQLAAKYDAVPEIGEVVIARDMTFYNEPMLRQINDSSSVTALLAAGYTTALDEQNQRNDMVSMAGYWKHTRVGYTFNPYESVSPVSYSEAFTAQLMAYGRQVLGSQLVLNNCSARVSYINTPGYFAQMYASMKQLGTPLGFQTAVLSKVGDLLATVQGLVALGAGNVELPPGFEMALTTAQLATLSQSLLNS